MHGLIAPAVSLLARTWRWRVAGPEISGGSECVIFATWHAHLMPLVWRHRGNGITLVVGRHRDAELLARPAGAWGYRMARGSSGGGGVGALKAAIDRLEEGGTVAFTPDGPRGPAGKVKAGAPAAAVSSGRPIVAVGLAAAPAWRASSWDRFVVPAPFARVAAVYSEPRYLTGHERESGPDIVRSLLDTVTREARDLLALE